MTGINLEVRAAWERISLSIPIPAHRKVTLLDNHLFECVVVGARGGDNVNVIVKRWIE